MTNNGWCSIKPNQPTNQPNNQTNKQTNSLIDHHPLTHDWLPPYNSLNHYYPFTPKIYELPKAYKPGIPVRLMISEVGSVPHKIVNYQSKY